MSLARCPRARRLSNLRWCKRAAAVADVVALFASFAACGGQQASSLAQARVWSHAAFQLQDSITGRGRLLLDPKLIACSRTRIFVFDYGDHTLKAFGFDGSPRWRVGGLGADRGDFANPTDMQVDALGDVWVADPQANRISVVTPAGEFARTFEDERNVARILPVAQGAFWAWSPMHSAPALIDSTGHLVGQLEMPAALRRVSAPAATPWLTGTPDGNLVVVYNYDNRFGLVQRGARNEVLHDGIEGPQAFPKLVNDSIVVNGNVYQSQHLDGRAHLVTRAASVSGERLYILPAAGSRADGRAEVVDSYRVNDGAYVVSYRLPASVSGFRVCGGRFLGLTPVPRPTIWVWTLAEGH